MNNIEKFEGYFRKYIQDLNKWLPEGIVEVDLELLHQFDLLNFQSGEMQKDDSLTRFFHVVESDEKITLVNEQFVIWIVPEPAENAVATYTLIALNQPKEPKLELVFSVSGVYNTSKLVLRILEKYLQEIQENEDELHRLKKAS